MVYEREVTGQISPEDAIHCDLQSIESTLATLQFPITKKDLLACVGEEQVNCSAGDQHTLRDLLEPLTKEQYNSVVDIQDTLAHPVRLAHP